MEPQRIYTIIGRFNRLASLLEEQDFSNVCVLVRSECYTGVDNLVGGWFCVLWLSVRPFCASLADGLCNMTHKY